MIQRAASGSSDPPARGEAGTWRSQTRNALVALRIDAGAQVRAQWGAAIDQHLPDVLPDPEGHVLAFCWPYKAEHDVRPAVKQWIARGGTAALPVIVAPGTPMVFRRWDPAAEVTAGAYGIPVPVGTEELRPDTILIPLNGFDAAGFRLGYGGGYFDRTVADLRPRPVLIGIAFELARLPTIHPEAHDEPMNIIVTEAGIQRFDATSASA